MLSHVVIFNLKDGEDKKHFVQQLQALEKIKYVKAIYVGTPASTPSRDEIVSDYDVMFTSIFQTVADHNAYSVDLLHDKFLEENAHRWERVRVFDAD